LICTNSWGLGQIMRIRKRDVGRGALLAPLAVLLFSVPVSAQTPSAQSSAEQKRQVQARVVDTVDDTNRVVMKGNVHPKARAEFDRGAVSDAQPITRMLLLLQRSPEQELQLQQLMEGQQAKNSPNFHAWLTPDQFGAQFGPADADVQAVTSWLTSHGFQNLKVSKGKIAVEFSGNVGQVRNAFGTEIHKFTVNGEEHFANVSDPQIPAALAPVVKGIRSLHNFRAKPQVRNLGSFRRTETGEIRPLFTYTDANGQFFGLGPADFAAIYSVPAAITGAGQTIAIVGRSNVNLQDVRDFRTMFGLPANDPNIILNGPDPGLVAGDETEADLDVEWSGAVAPAATIDFVVTESTLTDGTDGVDASAMYIIDNNIAPILSESFGSCESSLLSAGNAFFNGLWQQAAAQGITVVVAAGDNGSAACDPASATANQDAAASGLAISGIASTPFNTALGGTDFDDVNNQSAFWNTTNTSTTAVVASAKGYIPERTWNDSCAAAGSTNGCTAAIVNANNAAAIANGGPGIDLGSGSGGQSAVYAKPTWQAGFGADTTRDIPDVSLFSSDNGSQTSAANSFYIICESDQDPAGGTGCNLTTTASLKTHDFLAVGGTSAATPTFAAIMSLVIQQQAGQRQGVANPVLYSLAKTAANVCNSSTATLPNVCVFYDVTKGNNSVACVGGSLNCSNGTAGQFGIMATSSGGTTPAFNAVPGYDLATGLGTVNVTNLITKWAAPSLTGTSTSLVLVGTAPSTIGASATFTGSVTKLSGTANPTGVVLLRDSSTGTLIDTGSVVSTGCTAPAVPPCYTITTTFLPASATTYNVVAHYGGDGTFGASDSAGVPINIPKQNSQVLVDFLTTNANGVTTQNTTSATVAYGSSYFVRVDVTNTGGTPCQNASAAVTFVCPTGSIQLFQNPGVALNDFPNAQNANATSIARLNDRGFAEDQPIQLAPGAYHISATYTADTNSSFNSSSTSNTVAVTVTQATTTTTLAPPSPASIASGGMVTLTATVNTTSNGAGPTGTVQFKNGSSNLGAAATCTPTAANTSAAFCTATLTTALSQFVPLSRPQPKTRIPEAPLWIGALLALLILALAQHAARLQQRWPRVGKRLGYAAAGLLLFACLAAGFAGCGGGSSSTGGGGGSHTDSITAVYSGDTNYSGSTATAVSVTVQ
jgi:subtilase family serine protease